MSADNTPAADQGDRKGSVPDLDAHERWQRTAVAAFFLAEARGFVPGHELADWLAAERLVDAALIAASVPVDEVVAATASAVAPVDGKPIRRARKTAVKHAAGSASPAAEPAPKKKAATARKSTSRTRKSKPGVEEDLGGVA